MKILNVLGFIAFLAVANHASAAPCGDGGGNNKCLRVTCGTNSYEALAEDKMITADLALVLQTKGPNNPATIVSFRNKARAITGIQSTKYKVEGDGSISIKVEMKNFDSYEITGLINCHDIDFATGDIVINQYVGGFAGAIPVSRAKCSCLK